VFAKIEISKQRQLYQLLAKVLCCIVVLTAVFGATSSVDAAANTQPSAVTVVVVSRLVLWARPSYRSPIVAVLFMGREFTAVGRSASGRWIYGVTDMGTPGWLPSRGFLMLHREVRLRALPVFTSMGTPLMMPMPSPTPMPTQMPSMMGY
jgi:hypothetical protein